MVKAKKNQPFRQGSEAAYAPGGLHKFFNKKKTTTSAKKKKKIGRPAKNKAKTVGCPSSSNKLPPTPPPHLRKSPPEIAAAGKAAKGGDDSVDVAEAFKDDDNNPKKKRGQNNWGKEPHRGELEKAIDDCLNKTGNALDSNGEEIKDVYLYAGLVGIPFGTLYRYLCPAEDKRRIL